MKKLLIVVTLSTLLMIGFFDTLYATDIREGDVIVWKSYSFILWDVPFPTILLEILHQTELFTHVDYVGANGILYTSIQGQGSSISNVNSRLRHFYKGVVLRDNKLTALDIFNISESAYNQNVQYDDIKNQMIALDSLLWGNEIRFFGNLGFYPYMLVCSTAVAKMFQDNVEPHSVRDASVSSPSDIYYWEGWEVAGTFNNFN
jgi:hypothetical protein